jgi:hypothetical protein
MKTTRSRGFLVPSIAILGMLFLSYVLGAAVIFFGLPTSDYLHNAFVGARAWNERRKVSAQTKDQRLLPATIGQIDKPEKTFDGFTLYLSATMAASKTQAALIDMRGNVVHKWATSFSKVWATAPHLEKKVSDSLVCFFSCRLYPNGDLLVVFHGLELFPDGYGIARLDKDSNVIWRYSAKIHHDVDVGEDGTIYALKHEVVPTMPKGLESISTPCVFDYLVMLSPKGKELTEPISIPLAFRNSQYAPLLSSHRKPQAKDVFLNSPGLPFVDQPRTGDYFHTNAVQVLTRGLATKFPHFKAGQVLISVRELDTIAVLDTQKGSVVWAARGPWRAQHDAQFLDNGHLLIYDNRGSLEGARVLEYDPQTQAFPWSYSAEDGVVLNNPTRGMCQRLPNGNTLIVDSLGDKILEVTADKEVVWTCSCGGFIHLARRYSPDQLAFLKDGQRARP